MPNIDAGFWDDVIKCLTEHGWCRKSWETSDGKVCLGTAINLTVDKKVGRPSAWSSVEGDILREQAADQLFEVVKENYPERITGSNSHFYAMVEFNDWSQRRDPQPYTSLGYDKYDLTTKEEVQSMLEKVRANAD